MKQKIIKLFLQFSLLVPMHTTFADSCISQECDTSMETEEEQAYTRKPDCRINASKLKVCNNAIIGNLQVKCNQTVGGSVAVAGSDSVGGSETIGGDLAVAGNVTVADTVTTSSLVIIGFDITGLVTDAANTCTATNGAIFSGKIGNTLLFKCLEAGTGIALTSNSTSITVNATSTVVVTPVVTTTVTGGILAFAAATNYDAAQTIPAHGTVTFNNPGPALTITAPGVNGDTFIIPAGHPGTYYFEYHVRGTPYTALVPPAPIAFQLLNGVTPIAESQFASDTQTTSLPSSTDGGTLAVNGFVIATIDTSGASITLQNITSINGGATYYPVQLMPTAQQGDTGGPAAVNATLIIEQIA